MKFFRFFVLFLLAIITCSPFGSAYTSELKGVDLTKLQDWDIVISTDAIESEVYAAQEFRNFFELASGIKLSIVKETSRDNQHIFIGASEAMKKSNVGFSVDQFGAEDLRIIIRDNNIAIAGGRPRGTLYGVYTFLEDYLDIRFLTADHTYIPKFENYRTAGPVDRFYHPRFSFRLGGNKELDNDFSFAAKLRVNGLWKMTQKFGGRENFMVINHSFYRQVPSQVYGKDHPEYFAMIDGKRRCDVEFDAPLSGTELCTSNPDLVDLIVEKVIEEYQADPNRTNISVSQNDNYHNCQCDKCAAIDKNEDSHMGSHLTLVNAVARKIEKKYPDLKIGTLAYLYSRKPPKTLKPRNNVQIQLCSIECSVFIPLTDERSKRNADFCNDLDGWSNICDHISIWNYNANFAAYLLPFPGLRTLQPNIRYFASKNVNQIYLQGANAVATDMSDIRNYVTCQLLWDPSKNADQLINEFVSLHYGNAAPAVMEYINLVHDTVEAKGSKKVNYSGHNDSFGYDDEFVKNAKKIFDQALSLAENDTIRNRVEKLSIGVYAVEVDDIFEWIRKNGHLMPDQRPDQQLLDRTLPSLKKLFELIDKHGVTHWDEGVHISMARDLLRKAYALEKL